MRTTAAVRDYTGDPLPDDVLERILDNARFAPSGGNRQGARVIVIRDRGTREAWRSRRFRARDGIAQLQNGESPWNPLHPQRATAGEIAATEAPAQLTAPLSTPRCVLAVFVNLEVVAAVDQDLDRIGVVSGGSVYPWCGTSCSSRATKGSAAPSPPAPLAEEPRVRELLGVPESFALAALLPLGKPPKQLTK